jgi:hypothetical protein
LGQKALWIDEIWSIGISRMPWHAFLWSVQNQDPNMALYYVLLHGWMRLGESELVVRAMSVPMGVVTIWALYALGNHLFGRSVALIAGALLTLNAFHIQWSQEARGYSLLVLLVTLSSLFFVKSIERPSTGNFAVYGLLSVLALYAHVYAVLVLASHWISLAFLKRCDVPWKGLVVSTGLVGVLTAPLGLLILERARHPYFPLGWLPKLSPHVVYDIFYALAGNADFPGSHGGKTILAAYVVFCFITLVSWLRIWWLHGRSFDTWRTAFVFSWLLVPFALATAVSLVQPMLMNRYLISCLPALVLLAAQGIRSIKPAWVSGMVLVVVLGLASLRLPQYYQHRARFQAWKTVTDYIVAKARPGDGAVFCVAPGRILFDYYREKDHRGVNLSLDILYPEPGDLRQDPRTLDYLPALNSSLLDSAATHHSRMWVIVYHDTFAATEQARDRIEAALATQYRDSQKTKFGGVTVILYSNGFVQREP